MSPKVPQQFAALLFVGLGLEGCSPSRVNRATEYGFTETTQDRAVVEAACALTNDVLPPTSPRVAPHWTEASRFADPATVPVYVVSQGKQLDPAEIALVPSKTRCIFVNQPGFRQWVQEMRPGLFGDGVLAVSDQAVMAVILLHEIGHIHLNHGGSYREFTPIDSPNLSSVNLEENRFKSSEFEADAFAARQIREALQQEPSQDPKRSSSALMLSAAAMNLSFAIPQRLNAYLRHFRARTAFWDQGYSHPNMSLRMLIFNNLIQQSRDSARLLEEFQSARDNTDSKADEEFQRLTAEFQNRVRMLPRNVIIRNTTDKRMNLFLCRQDRPPQDLQTYDKVVFIESGETFPLVLSNDTWFFITDADEYQTGARLYIHNHFGALKTGDVLLIEP